VGYFFSLFELALVLNAIRRSVQSRFLGGIGLAVARLGVLFAAVAMSWTAGSTNGISSVMLLCGALGPLLSFAALGLAWHRKGSVAPASEEAEPRERTFTAWMGVAILDAMFVVVAIAANAIGPGI